VGLLDGRFALVTGASRGIGRAIATLFAREGARVALTARDAGLLRRVEQSLAGEGHCVVPADLSSRSQIDGLAERVIRASEGSIDIVVNNASILGPRRLLSECSVEEFHDTLTVNLLAIFHLTSQLIPSLSASGNGSIINVTSTVGREARAEWGPYAVSKFGVEALTQTWAIELQPSGIRVNAVNPGGTRTQMRAEAVPDEDPSTLPAPDAIAPIFLWLASDLSRDVNGQSLDAREWSWPGESAT
jgi:NAD(P)-dependent dehydrogenase (short-subunit alcohol dehydrogenase family)